MDLLPTGITNGVGVAALLVVLFWMLATGRLCTGRELREKNTRIERLEAIVEVRDKQLQAMLSEYLPAANSIMKALHSAASDEVSNE